MLNSILGPLPTIYQYHHSLHTQFWHLKMFSDIAKSPQEAECFSVDNHCPTYSMITNYRNTEEDFSFLYI